MELYGQVHVLKARVLFPEETKDGTWAFALAYRNSAADHFVDLAVRRPARLTRGPHRPAQALGDDGDGKPGKVPGFSVS
jgi:hypothetical protein